MAWTDSGPRLEFVGIQSCSKNTDRKRGPKIRAENAASCLISYQTCNKQHFRYQDSKSLRNVTICIEANPQRGHKCTHSQREESKLESLVCYFWVEMFRTALISQIRTGYRCRYKTCIMFCRCMKEASRNREPKPERKERCHFKAARRFDCIFLVLPHARCVWSPCVCVVCVW